jgi:hypothetical protein
MAVGAKGSKTKATLIRTRTALPTKDSETDSSFAIFFPQKFSKATNYIHVLTNKNLINY